MIVFRQYEQFKEKCMTFSENFEEKFFSDSKNLICHPLVKGEIISLCSDDEAHSNALCICRMADLLLMSEDNDNWSAFNLMEARSIAAQNGFVYISDLLAKNAFISEEWMINGKNDTIVVSEEYMKEKGKRYAPVTPLTNRVLHFKKYNNEFLWRSSPIDRLTIINAKYIEERLKDYYKECSAALPDLSGAKTINFPLFGDDVAIDASTTRTIVVESYFADIDRMMDIFNGNAELFDIVGYSFSPLDFILDLTAAALRMNGIELSKEEFAEKYYSPVINGDNIAEKLAALSSRCGNEDIDCIKIAFNDAVAAEYKEDENAEKKTVSPAAEDVNFYKNGIRRLEQGSYSDDEEKFIIEELAANRPTDYRIFYYAAHKYPDEEKNLRDIAAFWQIAPVDEQELVNVILNDYILDESFDEQGRFCAGYEQSCILKEQLEKVNEKYGLSNREYIDELAEHIDILDKERRTFNGTLFDTPEEMQLAVKNEVYVRDLCRNLSALTEPELRFLMENIENTTLDEDTKAKYLVKVNLALDVVQTSALEQCCLSLPVMTLGEIAALRQEIVEYDYPEAVVKPFMTKIKEASSTAQKNEIEAMLENSEQLSGEELDAILEKLAGDRYDAPIADHYRAKVLDIKESNIRAKIDSLMNGYEELGMEQMEELIKELSDEKYPKHLTYGPIKKVTDAINNYEINEAARVFDGVEFATAEQLEAMKHAIEYGKFSDEIAAPYISKVEQREKDLLNEELDEMCAGIDSMQQEELDKLKETITSSEKEYDPQLKEKYLDKIAQRTVELKNSELADLCKYIFSMEQKELDELKVKLSGENYDKEFTAVYFKKIEEREHELLVKEVEDLCGDLETKDIPELEKIKESILGNEKYAPLAEKYAASIDSRISDLKAADYIKIIDGTVTMSAEQIAEFRRNADEKRSQIGEELYARSMEAADLREDVLEDEKLERITGNISEYDFEKAEEVRNELNSGKYPAAKIAGYMDMIDERINDLMTADLDAIIADIGSMDKEQLIQAQIRIREYGHDCPSEFKQPYIYKIDKALLDVADKEVRELCGNISDLSAKKSSDLIRKLNTMELDEAAKERYIDALDAHISSLKKQDASHYISHLTSQMDAFNVNQVHLNVPTLSNLFFNKYDAACKTYISAGRYELPVLLHEGSGGDSFVLTTEYLHIYSKGVMNRIKIDDIASFQAKKSILSSSLTAVEKNGNSVELPHVLNKNIVENVAKVLTSLINYIHDERSKEHMKELLENAAHEKAVQAATPVEIPKAAPAEEKPAEEVKEETPAAEKPAEEAKEETPAEEKPAEEAKEETPAEEKPAEEAKEETPAEEKPAEEAKEETPAEEKPAEEVKEETPAEEKPAEEIKEETPAEEKPAEEVKPEAPKAAETVRFCDQCGAKITNPKAKFCAECGNKLV